MGFIKTFYQFFNQCSHRFNFGHFFQLSSKTVGGFESDALFSIFFILATSSLVKIFLFQIVQNEAFEIFKMFKSSMRFTKVACWVTSKKKKKKKKKSATLMIFLCSYYCWSLLCCNHWRSLVELHILKSLKVTGSNTACSHHLFIYATNFSCIITMRLLIELKYILFLCWIYNYK